MRCPSHSGIRSGLISKLWNAAAAIGLLGIAAPFAAAGVPDAGAVPAGQPPGAPAPFVVPAWLYPGNSGTPANPKPLDAVTPLSVPGSRAHFTRAQIGNLFEVPDWHPGAHPPMPDAVAHGRRPQRYACAYCHLATGGGRPENAALAGLPAPYIEQQMADFRTGARRSAWAAGYYPTELMRQVAADTTATDTAAAAAYFFSLKLTPRVRVVEIEQVPKTIDKGWLYALVKGAGTEPIGHRIIEVAENQERHELRDPTAGFIAYVPPGSLQRGRKIGTTGVESPATACTACHGVDLKGTGLIPPLAGRLPTYIVRQLLAFRSGARATDAGRPMQAVVIQLSIDDMIAVAAYAGSLPP